MDERDIAELFLVSFMRSVLDVKAPYSEKVEVLQNYEEMQASLLRVENEVKPLPRPVLMKKEQPVQIVNPKIPQPKPVAAYKPQRSMLNYPIPISTTQKLNNLLRDVYINEIECVGADNPLMVKKSGMLQKTDVSLTVDEIYELIAEFSQKTRIPIINGKIKAALNDLIITAVLSETLGPRFIIQRKKLFNPLII
jgi:hypothetical protein